MTDKRLIAADALFMIFYIGIAAALIGVLAAVGIIYATGYELDTLHVGAVWVGLVGLFSTIVPYATVPFELWAQKRGLLEGPWRLAPGGEAPKNFPEHVEAWVLRRPLIAIVLVVIAVIAVFTTLLWLGPPGGPRG